MLFTPGASASDELAVTAEAGEADQLVNMLSKSDDVFSFAVSDMELAVPVMLRGSRGWHSSLRES